MEGVSGTVLSVGQVCSYLKQIFEAEEMLHNITVLGEVSNSKTAGGYIYFNLKDRYGVLPCVCFGLPKGELPVDGDKVLVSGSLSFYQKGGKLSFIVSKIGFAGVGELMLYYQEVKEKLEKEGLFDIARKKPIPNFPNKVCIVTSVTGAVIHDFVRTIRNKNNVIDISVIDVRVQGEDAVKDIINGLRLADKSGADIVVLARGGGSWEDLTPFCDEGLARTVADMNTPIITAVGHETDTTLVDFVSDLRVATPTAAAEVVGFSVKAEIDYVKDLLAKIQRQVDRQYDSIENKIRSLNTYISAKAENCYQNTYNKLDLLKFKISNSVQSVAMDRESKLQILIDRLNLSNPINILKKGLFKVSNDKGIIKERNDVSVGEEIKVDSIEFSIRAEVKEVVGNKEKKL